MVSSGRSDAGKTITKIGLCGFTMAISKYSRCFPMVEVQQTFYQPPAKGVIERWRASVPAAFEFTIKAWQLITHNSASPTYRRLRRPLSSREKVDAGGFGDTAIVHEAWETTLAAARILRATAVLFQCPASFKPTDESAASMAAFFGRIDRPAGIRFLWEPRGAWPEAMVASLCSSHRLVHVVDPFVNRTVTGGFTYYRLHGISGSRHVYSDEELVRLQGMLPVNGETYVLFNNIPRVGDAIRFGRLLGVEPHESACAPTFPATP